MPARTPEELAEAWLDDDDADEDEAGVTDEGLADFLGVSSRSLDPKKQEALKKLYRSLKRAWASGISREQRGDLVKMLGGRLPAG
jgi:hypothetical protein